MVTIADPPMMITISTGQENSLCTEMGGNYLLKDDKLVNSDPKQTTREQPILDTKFINSQPSTQESQESQDITEVKNSQIEANHQDINKTQPDSEKLKVIENQRRSLSSQSSSITSISSNSISTDTDDPQQSQSYTTDLIKRAKTLIEETSDSDPSKSLLTELLNSLIKARAEAGQYKIKSQLLSISSKDADMRYEVENELIKKQVERLKSQAENMDMLMNKVTHQKHTLNKYKNEIINKNKEIIRLRSFIKTPNLNGGGDFKRRRKSDSTSTQSGMLDTLGLLASQVLTEEGKKVENNSRRASNDSGLVSRSGSTSISGSNGYVMPKLNSFKHANPTSQSQSQQLQTNGQAANETTISEYSISN